HTSPAKAFPHLHSPSPASDRAILSPRRSSSDHSSPSRAGASSRSSLMFGPHIFCTCLSLLGHPSAPGLCFHPFERRNARSQVLYGLLEPLSLRIDDLRRRQKGAVHDAER